MTNPEALSPTSPTADALPLHYSLDPAPPAAGRRLLAWLQALPAHVRSMILWTASIGLVLLVGLADYATGYEVSVVLFYSAPILLIVHFEDRRSAILMAVVCTLVWWWADETSGHNYISIWHQVWETALRLTYFLLFVEAGTMMKSRLELLERAQHLEREIVRISEREQQRIGQDLHDGLCQHFAAAACTAGSIKARLGGTQAAEAQAVADLQTMILAGVQQARQIARGLFPVQNDAWGLHSALSELAASTTRMTGMQCHFVSAVTTAPVGNACATHLYRTAQEALANALRHGQADTATITLSVDAEEVLLTIADNGRGFGQAPATSPGLGLSIMQHRAKEMDATVTLTGIQGKGATVTCRVPLAAAPVGA